MWMKRGWRPAITIRSLKNEPTLNDRARKLLSFTDNRQAVDGAPGMRIPSDADQRSEVMAIAIPK